MEKTHYDYKTDGKNITLLKPDSFILSQIFECGQCFRYEKIDDESYITVAYGKLLKIKKVGEDIIFYETSEKDFKELWVNYFDLDRDYSLIKKQLSEDETLKDAIAYADGIRILRQDFFECLISFIISQNNRIPMIRKVIKNICEKYGEYISDFNGEKIYSFPKPEKLAATSQEELMACKTGFRWKYIIDAAQKTLDGTLNYEKLCKSDTQEIKSRLTEVKGVGAKVADCVLLFSFGRSEVFPTDVWIKRIMSEFYFDKADVDPNGTSLKAQELFGDYAGFAQQYLFNYAREKKIGK